VLRRNQAGQVLGAGGPLGVGNLPAGKVALADVAHLALFDQVVQGLQRLDDRCLGIGPMELVQIDVVRLQPPQAGFGGFDDVPPRGATLVGRFAHGHGEFRGDDHVVAATAEAFADEFLGLAQAVHVGGVEQRNALLERAIEDSTRLVEVDPSAKVVGTQADLRNQEPGAPQPPIVHSACALFFLQRTEDWGFYVDLAAP